jgi:hypothetical protein
MAIVIAVENDTAIFTPGEHGVLQRMEMADWQQLWIWYRRDRTEPLPTLEDLDAPEDQVVFITPYGLWARVRGRWEPVEHECRGFYLGRTNPRLSRRLLPSNEEAGLPWAVR